MKPFTYFRAANTGEAVKLYNKHKPARYIAGATNLLDLMKKEIEQPACIIDINQLPLKSIQHNNTTGLQIGALVPNSEAAEHPLVVKHQPLVAKALLAGASPQLRNMATMGGNLLQRTRCPYFYDTAMPCNKRAPGSGCGAAEGLNRYAAIFGASPACVAVHPSDLCVALAALNATVTTHNGVATKNIDFLGFHRLPENQPEKDNNLPDGHLITHITIPPNNYNRFEYVKIRDRASYAFALVSVAVALQVSGNTIKRIALAAGGVAHKPWRLKEAESFLTGKTLTAENINMGAKLTMAGAKPLSHNTFKIKMLERAVVQAIQQATAL
ncbi:MAG: xanthine dehydrogenase family protein subunit M [Dinghuibacter sp.]|nr:xanthine dehydrogenase family protein subunit M [Dinghuibacter sp.]